MDKINNLLGHLMVNRERQRQDIAKRSQVALNSLTPACDNILDVCLSLIDRASEKPFESDHPLSHSMFLAAQFLQGVDITRMLILSGAYHQAANLLKQESEILDAMHEIRVGIRMDKKTTRFKGEMQNLGRKYGELNQISHPTNADVVEWLASKVEGDNVDPTLEIQFKEELCKDFFGYHSLLVSKISVELAVVMINTIGNNLTDEESNSFLLALNTLITEGAFKCSGSDLT